MTRGSRLVVAKVQRCTAAGFSTLLIDVPGDHASDAAAFWSAALSMSRRCPVPGEEEFTSLPGAVPGLVTAIQAVDDEPRYHVDIETDDVAAETTRLVALGAVELRGWLDCRILRAPGGHLLCVIPLHSDPGTFRRLARVRD